MPEKKKYEAIVIGASTGGLSALSFLLEELPAGFRIPIIVVQHRAKEDRTLLEEVMQEKNSIRIKQADEKEQVTGGSVYFAPPDYHLLIERDHSFSLSCDPPVNFSRPSIDVLFESASEAYGEKLLGIILTGANKDGTTGIKAIRKAGGTTIVQNPENAQAPQMPKAAIESGGVQHIMELKEIKKFIAQLAKNN